MSSDSTSRTLLALVGVMLVSAYQRLALYETAYGFSRLRTYTHVFMFWLGLLLGVVVILEILRRARLFTNATLLAALGFAVTISLLNMDAFIVRQNVERALAGRDLDVGYLASLSNDSIPVLVDLYQEPELTPKTQQAVGAALTCIASQQGNRDTNWRAFHISTARGEKALEAISNELDGYQVDDVEWPQQVTTPDGETYDCWSGWMD